MVSLMKDKLLHSLARLYNIQPVYIDAWGRLLESPPESILRVLQILGAQVEHVGDLGDALRQRRQFLWQRMIDPVVVSWEGSPVKLKVRLPRELTETTANYYITLEDGQIMEGRCADDATIKPVAHCVEGMAFVSRRLILPDRVPLGRHRLHLQLGELPLEAYLFASPVEAFSQTEAKAKRWGLFCPLYALTSERNLGAGDFSDLGAFAEFAGSMGAGFVGTLPLLAAFLDEPFNPSPYAPVSRLFWNELYLDIHRIPELHRCAAAKAAMHSSGFRTELANLQRAPLVEYRKLMALKRDILEKLLLCLLSQPSKRREGFEHFVATHPGAQDYAAFRAKVERERKPWAQWPALNRDGQLRPGDYDENTKKYHLYVQWQAQEQLRDITSKAQSNGCALYLDYPLGVNRDGYDVWRERGVFALEASGGAPPDGFFTKGQDWGFPPLHPDELRREGYRYYVQCLRHHLQFAKILRIDHVMGLHRFYWVPRGFAPTEGVYVRYPAEEFYGILTLESHRHHAQIVGENLGTVAPRVNADMHLHHIRGMYVGQFGVSADPKQALDKIPKDIVASLNTHDTPTFAGFWNGDDIQDRLELGLLTESESAVEFQGRESQKQALTAFLTSQGWLRDPSPDLAAILRSWLSQMASSDAYLLLINLEDLWLEPLPQNVPGTWEERPNWKRKAPFTLEAIRRMPSLVKTLKVIDKIRKEGAERH
jgi:4-alpha-glucanotransferase